MSPGTRKVSEVPKLRIEVFKGRASSPGTCAS